MWYSGLYLQYRESELHPAVFNRIIFLSGVASDIITLTACACHQNLEVKKI